MALMSVNQPEPKEKKPSKLENASKILGMGANIAGVASNFMEAGKDKSEKSMNPMAASIMKKKGY